MINLTSVDALTLEPKQGQVMIQRREVGAVSSDIIILPDTAINYDSATAKVLKVGPGERLSDGTREPMPVKPGDTVISWGGYGFYLDEKNRIALVDITEIEAVIESEDNSN